MGSRFSHANMLWRQGEIERAVEIYRRLVDENPDFYPYRFNLTKGLCALGRTREVETLLLKDQEAAGRNNGHYSDFNAGVESVRSEYERVVGDFVESNSGRAVKGGREEAESARSREIRFLRAQVATGFAMWQHHRDVATKRSK